MMKASPPGQLGRIALHHAMLVYHPEQGSAMILPFALDTPTNLNCVTHNPAQVVWLNLLKLLDVGKSIIEAVIGMTGSRRDVH